MTKAPRIVAVSNGYKVLSGIRLPPYSLPAYTLFCPQCLRVIAQEQWQAMRYDFGCECGAAFALYSRNAKKYLTCRKSWSPDRQVTTCEL